MTSISVTKAEFGFSVGVSTDPDTTFTLERMQFDGVVRPVKGAQRLLSTGEPLFIYDYTLLQNAVPLYRIRHHGALSDTVTDWYDTGDFVDFGGDVLFGAADPRQRMKVTVESFPTVDHDISQEVVRILGRPDPVVVSNRRQYESGTLNLLTLSHDERRSLLALLEAAPVITFSPHKPFYGFDNVWYLSVGKITETRPSPRPWEPARRWALDVQRVEAPRPAQPIATPTDPTEPPAPGDLVWSNWTDRKWVDLTTLNWQKVAGI